MELQDWVSVKEMLPKPEKAYLVAINDRGVFKMYYGLTHKGTLDWYYDDEIVKPYMQPDFWTNVPDMPNKITH